MSVEHAHGPDVPEAMSRKLGPLPLGVWLLAIAGGLGMAVYLRRHGAAAAPAAPPTDPGTVASTDTAPGAGNLYSPPASNPTGTDLTTASPASNDEWSMTVERKLLAKGYAPLLVDSALRDYLAGAELSISERAVIAEALVLVGPPPQAPIGATPGADPHPSPVPAPGTTPAPKPSSTPASRPPAPRPSSSPASYVIRHGDTLGGIASAHHTTAAHLYALNAGTLDAAARQHRRHDSGHGQWIYPGTTIRLR